MAAAHIKHLEDRLARYERTMHGCSRCRAALESAEEMDAASSAAPPPTTGSLLQRKPRVSSSALTRSTRPPIPTTGQDQSDRSSMQATSASQPKPSSSRTNAASVSSSTRGASNRSGKAATRDPVPIARQDQSNRSSKQATSASQPKPSSSHNNAASLSSSTRESPNRSMETVTRLPVSTAHHPSSGPSKQTNANAVPSLTDNSSRRRTLTSDSLDSRPAYLRPSASAKDIFVPLPADPSWVNMTRPSLSGSFRHTQRRRNDPQKADWLVSADKMLEEVPLGWIWHVKILEVDKSMLAAVAIDTSTGPDEITGAPNDTHDKNDLLRLVRSFAHRHSDKRLNFQHFLLVCLCIVLSGQNIPQSSIIETLQICISDTSKANVVRYLKGARWANELLNRLFFSGWRYRAVDLIAIWDRSIATYARLSTTLDPSGDYFASHLTQSEYCQDIEEVPNRVHNTIPWIVKKELEDEVSYGIICKALGYSDEYILETKDLHSDSDSEDEVSASGSRSADGVSSNLQLNPQEYLRAWSLLGQSLVPNHSQEDLASRDPRKNQSADSQEARRTIPDRSFRLSGNSDAPRQRRPLDDISSSGEHFVSTSLKESAPATQGEKRPLPNSPTSQLQSESAARRRQQIRQMPSREEMSPSSHSGRKDSYQLRSRT